MSFQIKKFLNSKKPKITFLKFKLNLILLKIIISINYKI